jgi:hypothetical protein
MTPDKTLLKRQIDQSKLNEMLILNVNKLEKNSLNMCQKRIEKFVKKQEDYVVTVFKK